jgi:isopenicillin N synthase-like dioxygenase
MTSLTHSPVPVIDLGRFTHGSPEQQLAVARAVDQALVEVGFFVVANHGMSAEVIAEADRQSRRFFELPMDGKMAIRTMAKGSPRGYVPIGVSTLGRTAGETPPDDLKEGFGMGPASVAGRQAESPFHAPNQWPRELPELRSALEAYYAGMEDLSRRLFEVFALALGLQANHFESYFTGHNSTLRVINYPPQQVPPQPGQLRAGAHTDFGAFTILLSENASGGLQVRTRDGRWIDIEAEPGSFVINIGDLMMMWTNDRWLSNLHRVANPASELAHAERRQSIAFFANPREEALIECIPTCIPPGGAPRHPPVLAGEHRLQKIRAAAGK